VTGFDRIPCLRLDPESCIMFVHAEDLVEDLTSTLSSGKYLQQQHAHFGAA